MAVSLLNGRPSADNFSMSETLQEWSTATNIRLRFLRPKTTLGHLLSVERQDPTVTRRVSQSKFQFWISKVFVVFLQYQRHQHRRSMCVQWTRIAV